MSAESITEARHEFVAALAEKLPSFGVLESGSDSVAKASLYLRREAVSKSAVAQGVLTNTFALYVISPQNATDDEQDETLQTVLDALDDLQWAWGPEAEWQAWSETEPAYRIPLTAPSTRKK